VAVTVPVITERVDVEVFARLVSSSYEPKLSVITYEVSILVDTVVLVEMLRNFEQNDEAELEACRALTISLTIAHLLMARVSTSRSRGVASGLATA
jgi:hypothetical protein